MSEIWYSIKNYNLFSMWSNSCNTIFCYYSRIHIDIFGNSLNILSSKTELSTYYQRNITAINIANQPNAIFTTHNDSLFLVTFQMKTAPLNLLAHLKLIFRYYRHQINRAQIQSDLLQQENEKKNKRKIRTPRKCYTLHATWYNIHDHLCGNIVQL